MVERGERGLVKGWYGPMGGGKVELLMGSLRADGDYLIFVPYRGVGDDLMKPFGRKVLEGRVIGVPLGRDEAMLATIFGIMEQFPDTKQVLFNEVHFMPSALIGLVNVIASRGTEVGFSGMLLDSELRDFGPTRRLAQMADHAVPVLAQCDCRGLLGNCRQKAPYNYVKGKQTIGKSFNRGAYEWGSACCRHLPVVRRQLGMGRLPKGIDLSQIWRVEASNRMVVVVGKDGMSLYEENVGDVGFGQDEPSDELLNRLFGV